MLRMILIAGLVGLPAISAAQGLNVAFGSLQQDTSEPVEVTADSLSVDQNDGSAVFKGNVNIAQADMRMSADQVNVFYSAGGQGIEKLIADGDVLLVQGEDAAEADHAVYSIATGTVEMKGNVTVLQGVNTITSDEMLINLRDNTAKMQGRVRTIIRSE
nr:lipopolysaccharide transport periplasmic protein LptA [Shimia abyssi]